MLTISIHAAQEGCDVAEQVGNEPLYNFNPRSPRGLRQDKIKNGTSRKGISIHAAQEGCDRLFQPLRTHLNNFNPRSPRGLRQFGLLNLLNQKEFQSTQPKRAATKIAAFKTARDSISIHAAQEGCDIVLLKTVLLLGYFNPRSPRGLRPDTGTTAEIKSISIHAAQEGCDEELEAIVGKITISIHAAQEGCDQGCLLGGRIEFRISIHAAQEGCDKLPKKSAEL